MELHLLEGRELGGYATFGAVWSRGELWGTQFRLENDAKEQIPVQSKIQARWPDGSVKWSSHTADTRQMHHSVILQPATWAQECAQEGCVQEENIQEGRVQKGRIQDEGIQIRYREGGYRVTTGKLSMVIPSRLELPSRRLASEVVLDNSPAVESIYPVFRLENRYEKQKEEGGPVVQCREEQEFQGVVTSVEIEEDGPLQAVFCFRGGHVTGQNAKMPFIIRMYLWKDSSEIKFVHTFLFDGKEERDFLKGMGIRFDTKLSGAMYDRHVQYATDGAVCHEAAVILASSHPRLSPEVLKKQLGGVRGCYEDEDIQKASKMLPVWDHYAICQDSAYHYAVRKRTQKECCDLVCTQGKRAPGVMAVTGLETGLMIAIRDFWQKHPSGLEADGLSKEICKCTAWFYSPQAEAFDFRHYSTKSYPQTCYEGFEEVGASAYGIGVTSECSVVIQAKVPADEELTAYGKRIQKPAVYVGTPQYYYSKRAFGYWSLPAAETEVQRWLEKQLDKAFAFYHKEVEARDWYGLFDYGDVMHTYDAVRHTWKYDMGGFAWDNTELVPTYWLWLYFLRTGREDVFTMAEALSRHSCEVDVYHFGPLKGLGSRHNVRHWGCSCKEPRVAMAGHHRFLYYLTGDYRIGDVMEDVKDADYAMVKNPHAGEIQPDGKLIPGARSGPDWSSFVSNWMTQYERTLDEAYRRKIETGTTDIAATPYGFASGPDYYYDVKEAHLIYRGEIEGTPNQHLQICMGGPQIWMETADMLGDDTLKRMLADLGAFYFLDSEEKARLTEGRIWKRAFSWPMFATGIAAYSAMRYRNEKLAHQTWNILTGALWDADGLEMLRTQQYCVKSDGTPQMEMPGISTNFTSQWCLNTIMCLEFIREYLPKTLNELNGCPFQRTGRNKNEERLSAD